MEIEGTIQFIVNQQAQFVADIHSLQQSQRELQEGQREIQKGQKQLGETVAKLTEVVRNHEDAHVVTAGMISKLTNTLTDYVERQGWLFDAQKRTETTLGKFIDKMDGFIDEMRRNQEDRNGGGHIKE